MSSNAPVFVTMDDASEAQRAEAEVYGGQNPRGGIAAQMQVSGLLSGLWLMSDNRCVQSAAAKAENVRRDLV